MNDTHMNRLNNPSENEVISISEIDEQLLKDTDGSYKKALLDKIQKHKESVTRSLGGGNLTPQEFEAAKKLQEALTQAENIVKDR